jgi:hypothetical protein
VVIDLPCGDGRNLAALVDGASILLGADTSTKAKAKAKAIAEGVAGQAETAANTIFPRVAAVDTGPLDNSAGRTYRWDLLGHLRNAQDALKALHSPAGPIVANRRQMTDCKTFNPDIKEIAPKEYIGHFLMSSLTEPAHAEYRPYTHDHESLAFTIRKG